MDLNKLSSYQNPEGKLRDRLAPRTDLRKSMINWGCVHKGHTFLDIGCNNGYFVREAARHGSHRAVGVDVSDCIVGARQLAEEEGLKTAEFWQMDVESSEFQRWCPRFDVIFLFSVLTHLKDKERFLDWLDSRVKYLLVFESNHGEVHKNQIDLVRKHIWFDDVEYLGPSDIPEKPHYMWECRKASHEMRYPKISGALVTFLPIDEIKGWDEVTIMHQHRKYSVESEEFLILKEDIKRRGIRNPLVVERQPDGRIVGFQGGHRYLAAKYLGYKDVPVKIL